jgi:hypothetical protein
LTSFDKNGGQLPGKIYGDLIAHGSPLDVATRSSNSVVKEYAGRIKEALQDAMQAAATPANAARYAEARLRYKNMMTLAELVNKGIPGQISPLLLQGAANRSFKDNAFRGAGQLGELGDVAQQFLKAPLRVGTEPRQFVRDLIQGNLLGLLKGGYSKVTSNALRPASAGVRLTARRRFSNWGQCGYSTGASLARSGAGLANALIGPRPDLQIVFVKLAVLFVRQRRFSFSLASRAVTSQ